MIQNIRSRVSKKGAAALAVFAIALTVSGAGSMAVLTDVATTTISASITSIDLTANNSKAASIDFGQIEPGTIAYAPVTFRNGGSGYLNLSLSATSNGSPVSNDSVVQFIPGLFANACNSTDAPISLAYTKPIVQPVIDLDEGNVNSNSVVVPANGQFSVCAIYRVGTTAGVGYGQTGFQTTLTASATHP